MVALPLRIRPTILLFGDSITQQGFGWEGATGWASLLSSAYSRRADVLNRGFSGYNTRHGVDLVPRLIEQQPRDSRADDATNTSNDKDTSSQQGILFATVFFGANDAALPGERQHVPIDEYGNNLKKIVSHIRENAIAASRNNWDRTNTCSDKDEQSTSSNDDENNICFDSVPIHVPVILFTPPPVDVDAWHKARGSPKGEPNDRTNENSRQYGERVKDVAADLDCFVLDVFELLGGNGDAVDFGKHLRDGLHLSESGNILVYEGLMTLIKTEHMELAPMIDGQGKYASMGVPLEEKLWGELC